MTTFYLIRHGETEWNRNGNRYCGRTNVSLSKEGFIQADRLVTSLQDVHFDAVMVSSLQRAQQTAKPLLRKLDLETVIDDRLIEVDFGEWEGLTLSEVIYKFNHQWNMWKNDPTNIRAGGIGETAKDVFTRMMDFFIEHSTKQPHKRIVIISHNTAIRLFIAGTLGMPFGYYRRLRVNNTGISLFEMENTIDPCWKVINWIPGL